jgi:ABC-type lipoprotein export system ATPase subunit
VSAGEPLPLIVDDTLVNLCDGRARVAMELLFELSKKTQVLVFTHHASVASLAKDVGGDGAGVTRLPGDEERLRAVRGAAASSG